jgi:DNA-binding SARP family transcriptional activator
MDRNQVLKEVLADKELCDKYNIKDIEKLTTNAPYNSKLVEVLSVIINENDNNLSDSQIYKKIKNIHNIG